jgi:hypothetical protein
MLAAALLATAPVAVAQEGEGDVVYVPTPQRVVEAMLDLAKVGPADTLIDLGSGDGRVVITAARMHGANALGVDLDRYLLKLANAKAREAGVADRARFVEQNLFETDLSAATVITTYLLPEMNLRLQPKFLTLRPGTRIVAHDYDFDSNWAADAQQVMDVPGKTVGEPGKSYLYLYIVPARLAGDWQSRIRHGGQVVDYRFSFDQEFQFVEGAARVAKGVAKIPEFKLDGDRMEFAVRLAVQGRAVDHRFTGRVLGDRIKGTVTSGQGNAQREQPWSAHLVQAREISDGSGRPPRKYRHLKQ